MTLRNCSCPKRDIHLLVDLAYVRTCCNAPRSRGDAASGRSWGEADIEYRPPGVGNAAVANQRGSKVKNPAAPAVRREAEEEWN